ncbi:MAG: hypothetical protein ABSG51_09720, partial [Terracidiphilus sp.]
MIAANYRGLLRPQVPIIFVLLGEEQEQLRHEIRHYAPFKAGISADVQAEPSCDSKRNDGKNDLSAELGCISQLQKSHTD